MPMLALMLLLSSLFGDGSGPDEDALRKQILRAEAQPPAGAAARQTKRDVLPLQLYPLRQDRVLRLGSQPQEQTPSDGQRTAADRVRVAQLWERVDGQWRMQRSVSIDLLISHH